MAIPQPNAHAFDVAAHTSTTTSQAGCHPRQWTGADHPHSLPKNHYEGATLLTEELGGPACNCMLGKSGPFYFLFEACTPKYMGKH